MKTHSWTKGKLKKGRTPQINASNNKHLSHKYECLIVNKIGMYRTSEFRWRWELRHNLCFYTFISNLLVVPHVFFYMFMRRRFSVQVAAAIYFLVLASCKSKCQIKGYVDFACRYLTEDVATPIVFLKHLFHGDYAVRVLARSWVPRQRLSMCRSKHQLTSSSGRLTGPKYKYILKNTIDFT